MFKPRARASTISGNSFSQLLPGDEAGLTDPSYDLRSVDPTSYPLRTSSFAPDEKPANSFHHKRASLDQLYFASPLFDLDYGASPLDPFAPLDSHGLGGSSLHYRPQRSVSELDEDLLPDSLDYGLAPAASLRVGEAAYPGTRHNSLSLQPALGTEGYGTTLGTEGYGTTLGTEGYGTGLGTQPYGSMVKGAISLRHFSVAEETLLPGSQPLSESPVPA